MFNYLGALYDLVWSIVSGVAYYFDDQQIIQIPADVVASTVLLVCTLLEVVIGIFAVFLVLKGCYYVYKIFRGLF